MLPPQTYLPARSRLMSIIRIPRLDIVINPRQIQLLLRRIHNRLRDHLRVAELRLDMPVLVQAQIHIAMAHQQRASAVINQRGLVRRRGARTGRRRRARPLVVGRGRGERLLRALAAGRLARRARVGAVAGRERVAGRAGGRRGGLGLDDAGALEVLLGDLQGAEVDGEDEHHLDAADLDDLAAAQGAGLARLPRRAIHFKRITPLDIQPPLLLVAVEVDDSVQARDELARPQVDVHGVGVLVRRVGARLGGLGLAADVDRQPRDVEGPVEGRDFRIGLDALLVGLMDAVGMVPAGLAGHGRGDQMLGHAGDELVVVLDYGLVGNVRRVALVNRLGGLGCVGGIVILSGAGCIVSRIGGEATATGRRGGEIVDCVHLSVLQAAYLSAPLRGARRG